MMESESTQACEMTNRQDLEQRDSASGSFTFIAVAMEMGEQGGSDLLK